LDINGDMKTDIMFTDPIDNQIKVLISKDGVGQNYDLKLFSNFVISNDENPDCVDPNYNDTISSPNSNSFLDLNGDCMPDIFLQRTRVNKKSSQTTYSHYYEIYMQKQDAQGNQKYCLSANNTNMFLTN
jgi:hypothetical protein